MVALVFLGFQDLTFIILNLPRKPVWQLLTAVLVRRVSIMNWVATMRRRILLADDNPINQVLVRGCLAWAGYEVDIVADGGSAVEACTQQPYDVVLMDWEMPVLSGLEATRQIRELDIPQPNIVGVTARAMMGHRDECLRSGMDSFISKPFRAAALIEAVQMALREHKMPAAIEMLRIPAESA